MSETFLFKTLASPLHFALETVQLKRRNKVLIKVRHVDSPNKDFEKSLKPHSFWLTPTISFEPMILSTKEGLTKLSYLKAPALT